ncbi:hypothetical protein BP00DRAFT_478314 [Aspergillus indologenus CBS 114.80]|uniref:Uncharacterized protein n=1 Tax=Aspergillus indologenus CBS 114.80 TaxID=1450541 RepID=A0A2V5HZH4_9EURO|nr:hypothetical protein BP00DRAFT_478314 [Aspergillus indologenus CBS 114.80]
MTVRHLLLTKYYYIYHLNYFLQCLQHSEVEGVDCEIKNTKTYNRRDSLVVTHPTTNLPACGLSTAERTGSPVFHTLWSYVLSSRRGRLIFSDCERERVRNLRNHSVFEAIGRSSAQGCPPPTEVLVNDEGFRQLVVSNYCPRVWVKQIHAYSVGKEPDLVVRSGIWAPVRWCL